MSVFNEVVSADGEFRVKSYQSVKYDADSDTFTFMFPSTLHIYTDGSTVCEFDEHPGDVFIHAAWDVVQDVLGKYGFCSEYSQRFKDDKTGELHYLSYMHRGGKWDHFHISGSFASAFGKERAKQYYPQIAKRIAEKYDEFVTSYLEDQKAKAKTRALAQIKKQQDAWNPEWDADFEQNKSDAAKESNGYAVTEKVLDPDFYA